jgi:hypothetical protein
MMNNTELTLHLPTLLAARNQRNVLRNRYVDLSYVVDIIESYIALEIVDDPYVHSASILRIATLDSHASRHSHHPFESRLANFIIRTILENETWRVGDINTPDERLHEIFSNELLASFRVQLSMVPVIETINEQGASIFVPDLFVCEFLARPQGTIAETSRDIIAREERRLFRPNDETIRIQLIDECEMEGDSYEISEFDEWASGMDFPWDDEIVLDED